MAKQGQSAKSVDHLIRAQIRDSDRANKARTAKSGKSLVTKVLDAAAHLGR
jgi:hypothetical protein